MSTCLSGLDLPKLWHLRGDAGRSSLSRGMGQPGHDAVVRSSETMNERHGEQYGNFYWCIGTAEKNKAGKPVEAYIMADKGEILPNGALVVLKLADFVDLLGNCHFQFVADRGCGIAPRPERLAREVA